MKNNLASPPNKFLKALFDFFMVAILFFPSIVLMLFFAILIKLDSKGPVFFIQKRVGKDRILFNCFKFRTMYEDSEEILERYLAENDDAKREWLEYKKLKNGDPRVTRIGRFLRKTSLDELPQVFNVIMGQMSMIGPRPYLPHELSELGEYAEIIFQVRPGITGLWQVSGRNDLTFQDRIRLDVSYVINWSLWLDMVILVKTVGCVLRAEGAY